MNNLQQTLIQVNEELKQFEGLLQPENYKLASEQQTKEELVEFNLELAYSLSSLYYCYLKVNNIETQSHPILNEISRIQTAYQKYSFKYQQELNKQAEQRKSLIDKQAAQRLIKANVKSLDKNEMYIKKQQQLIQEQQDCTNRLEQVSIEHKNLDLWTDDQDNNNRKATDNNIKKQKLVRGNLIPQTGHLSWKKEIDKLIKK